MKRQFIGHCKISIKSLQGRHTANATGIKLIKVQLQDTTGKTNECFDSRKC